MIHSIACARNAAGASAPGATRAPTSPIAFSPRAGSGYQGRGLGGPNLNGGFGEIIGLGEINRHACNFRGHNLGVSLFRRGLLEPRQLRSVKHLGFHFRHRREIARLIVIHWFLTGLVVLIGVVVLVG